MRTLASLLLPAVLILGLSGCGAGSEDDGPADEQSSAAATPSDRPGGEGRAPSKAPGNPLASAAEAEAKKHKPGEIKPRDGLVFGGDISYPNCPEGLGIPQRETKNLPMPVPRAEFVVIGLTNGPAYFPNPCIADHVAWARSNRMMVAAYSVISYPDDQQLEQFGADGPYDTGTKLGRLRNAGHAQALFNMNTMRQAGLETPMVWLDIEPVRDWEWTSNIGENVAVIQGAVKGYQGAGYRLGFYSVPSLWRNIAGDWGLGLPEWRSAGDTSQKQALTRCTGNPDYSIQGGQPVLAQWWDLERDYNVTCPGIAADLSRWFHQY